MKVWQFATIVLAFIGGTALVIHFNPFGIGKKVTELGSAHPFV